MKSAIATELRSGTFVMIGGKACVIKNVDISKTGKHGASKCRIEAQGIFDGKKRIIAVPGSERFDIPIIDKRRGQVLSVTGNKASIMDLESFETLTVYIEEGLSVSDNMNVEYWSLGNEKMIKRIV
ncbi:MAG: translation initiation factor IF-5A [archaeon]|nr:MAG: translation initiation factor IF-5A [archaeon]